VIRVWLGSHINLPSIFGAPHQCKNYECRLTGLTHLPCLSLLTPMHTLLVPPCQRLLSLSAWINPPCIVDWGDEGTPTAFPPLQNVGGHGIHSNLRGLTP
jgi:hypothetical protein